MNTAGKLLMVASANYPKIQNKYNYRSSKESGEAVGNVLVWIISHWYIVLPAIIVILLVFAIRQSIKEHRRAAQIDEMRREMERKAREEAHRREQMNVKKETEAYKHHQFVVKQRRLMTDSLRYDILRRDGFRCQICGATAQDGWKLHVDHIIPVSKGGKTEPSNLRTLCERCNMGKGAKIE